ncbi:YdeI/OmpD-associated family protein [Occallatibacter savannae]|uniref:YdeI/OmpD-associated family protein n=1 Tax=Occallatibacter savannae TaxID=1002691 RepID=UPI0013A533B8|nr:YdeI/OmpD-associated family protein [Occallatibacter savannae]
MTKTFRAKLLVAETSPRWVFARVPVNLKKAWPAWKSRRVFGEMNGFAFKTALIPAGGKGFTLIVNRKMQAGAGARAGDTVEIRLAPDLGEVAIDLPAELATILKSDRSLKKFFEGISPSMRKGLSDLVADRKSREARQKRADAIAGALMMAMEGETEPPPILRVQFQSHPGAQRGWELMTPTQRRNHLLGIFFVQTVEGREKRTAKAIENCVDVARRRSASEQ